MADEQEKIRNYYATVRDIVQEQDSFVLQLNRSFTAEMKLAMKRTAESKDPSVFYFPEYKIALLEEEFDAAIRSVDSSLQVLGRLEEVDQEIKLKDALVDCLLLADTSNKKFKQLILDMLDQGKREGGIMDSLKVLSQWHKEALPPVQKEFDARIFRFQTKHYPQLQGMLYSKSERKYDI